MERDRVGKSGKLGGADRSRAAQRAVGGEGFARFEAFFDFAFDRVYRFARGRMSSEPRAQALCRLILFRARNALGGIGAFGTGPHRDPEDFAFWLYCLARKVADQVDERPDLLDASLERSDARETTAPVGFPPPRAAGLLKSGRSGARARTRLGGPS